MAAASSQLFGNWLSSGLQGFTGGLNKDWSAAFKTPLNTTQTLPAKPETMPGAASGFMGSSEMQLLREEKDPLVRMLILQDIKEQKDLTKVPGLLKAINDQRYEDRLRARPLELEELKEKQKLELQAKIAGGFLDMVTGFPAKLTAHRDMVAPMNELMRRTRREGINYGAVPVQRIF